MFDVEFLLTSFVVVVVPGTGVIYTVSTGLAFRARAGIVAAVGCTLGIVPHLTAGVLGLSALLHSSAVAFQALKYAGVAYLLYLAWSMWRDTGTLSFESTSVAPRSSARIVIRGILINLLNPKLTLFFFAFLPQFVQAGGAGATRHMITLSAMFMGMTLAVFVVYGLLASAVRTYVVRSPRAVRGAQRGFAVLFGVLAARLALVEQ
mgnify:CR=1 FL=1